MSASESRRIEWGTAVQSLTRPYPFSFGVAVPMFLLFVLVPCYIFIADLMIPGRVLHVPELPLDRAMPLLPAWALVYGSLYLFLILLPLFVVRQETQIRRTLLAYLTVWLIAFACFLLYPTKAPRPASVVGEGFAVWGLGLLYSGDPPYNCFPSLHVAHSVVSAWSCSLVNRGVGVLTAICAGLVGPSTLYTKQHYVLDVIAGVLLAGLACLVFLRRSPRETIPVLDRRVAPVLALGLLGIIGVGMFGMWLVYRLSEST